MDDLKTLPLDGLHRDLGAKMVPFAGYAMPVQYTKGVMAEHLHTRSAAGLFDVSHMGQVVLTGPWEDIARGLERIVPQDVYGLKEGRQKYGFLTNEAGGIEDDLMLARLGDALHIVVNGSRKYHDISIIEEFSEPGVHLEFRDEAPLVALQGPAAEAAFASIAPDVSDMRFMDVRQLNSEFGPLIVSRSGYSGEDGFEIAPPPQQAQAFCQALLACAGVAPAGLGARDSLRLEAGMPLYGQDLTPETTPIAADLGWAIQKVRRNNGGFLGASRILDELQHGAALRRTGLRPEGRAPMRAGVILYASKNAETPIGSVTSGGFAPSLGGPVAMGYVPADVTSGSTIYGDVRGKRLAATVTDLPFYQPRYKR